MKKIYLFAFLLSSFVTINAQVVISQIYGGGGNTGATYTHDFIELFNRGASAQNLNGWSVQYASATGPTNPPLWIKTNLSNFTLQPGQYYLIQQSIGTNPALALPTPDLNGIGNTTGSDGLPLATGISMSGSNGKVILVNTTVGETTVNPTGPQIIDKVGYGTTPTGFEGTGPTGTALTNTTSAQRNSIGCTDTNSNPSDFTAALPVPRNSSTAFTNCSLGNNENEIAGLNIYSNNKTLYVTSDSSSDKNITVYDLLGKVIINVTIENQPINVSNIATGAYIIQVTEEGKTTTKKLVIQ